MSVSINGSGAITYNDGSTQASAQVGMKNRIIDGGFIINQRGYTSGTSLSAGAYGHDRWKAGSGGGTYTFTQGSLGVNTTVTITAGTLVQVIEGCNLAEGGTYVLSWTGTAQGRLNGGTYGSSGTVTVTGWTAGTNLNVEFNTGTCGSVQLEKGSTATSFDYRPFSAELSLCQRYFQLLGQGFTGSTEGTSNIAINEKFQVTMRSAPSSSVVSGQSCSIRYLTGDVTNSSPTLTAPSANINGLWTLVGGFTGLTTNTPIQARNSITNNLFIALNSEL